MTKLTFDKSVLESAFRLHGETALINTALGDLGRLVTAISLYFSGEASESRLVTQVAETLLLTEQLLLLFKHNSALTSSSVAGLSQCLRESRFLCAGVLSALSTAQESGGDWIRPYVAKRISDLSAILTQTADALGLEEVQAEIVAKQDRLRLQVSEQHKPGLISEPNP